jgi:hypothetical protein
MKLGYKVYNYKHYSAYYLYVVLNDGTMYQIGNAHDKQEIIDKLEECSIDFKSLSLTTNGVYL